MKDSLLLVKIEHGLVLKLLPFSSLARRVGNKRNVAIFMNSLPCAPATLWLERVGYGCHVKRTKVLEQQGGNGP